MPSVSVIMSVYNGELHVETAVRSILQQEQFSDFEFIIIDDCSLDTTWQILQSWQKNDSRIVLFKNEVNVGLTKSLNRAIAHAKGEYIARIDADDIADPLRLSKQHSFMEQNKDIALCGTFGWIIDSGGRKIREKKFPTEHAEIKKMLIYNNQFIHSSLFIRRNILNEIGGYDEHFKKSQDYELAFRIAAVHKVANIAEPLISWRYGKQSLSWQNRGQEWYALQARIKAVRKYGYPTLKGVVIILFRTLWMLLPGSIRRLRYEC